MTVSESPAIDTREQELRYDLERARSAKAVALTQATIGTWNAAHKALEGYLAERSRAELPDDILLNASEIAAWLNREGWRGKQGGPVSERTVKYHIDLKTLVRGKEGFGKKSVLNYAQANLTAPPESSAPVLDQDHGNRLKKAMADERELKVAQLKSELLNAGEEAVRDAAILRGIMQQLEIAAPERAKRLISELAEFLTDEQRGLLTARLPELVEHDLERIADIFDRLAQDGGVRGEA